jgi:ParB family chromosome partitioning protein
MARASLAVSNRFQEIPISSIVEMDFQVRKHYDPDKLVELDQSMTEQGLLQPVVVQPMGPKFQLIIGSRRLKVAKKRKDKTIPACIVGKVEDKEAITMALVENLQRQNLTPFEDAWAFLKLIKDYGMSIQDVAKKIGCHQSMVQRRIKLLSVPTELQDMIAKGQLPLSHVDQIASVVSTDEQKRLAKEVTRHRLSARELVTHIHAELGRKQKSRIDKSLTGKRIELRIKGFARFLGGMTPSVIKMGGAEIENIKLALQHLIAEARKSVKTIEEV